MKICAFYNNTGLQYTHNRNFFQTYFQEIYKIVFNNGGFVVFIILVSIYGKTIQIKKVKKKYGPYEKVNQNQDYMLQKLKPKLNKTS